MIQMDPDPAVVLATNPVIVLPTTYASLSVSCGLSIHSSGFHHHC